MINRGLNKTSQYIFNSTTGMLEKLENKSSTIESLSKQAKQQIHNLDDITSSVNQDQQQTPVNNIVVITSDDNLIHNYYNE